MYRLSRPLLRASFYVFVLWCTADATEALPQGMQIVSVADVYDNPDAYAGRFFKTKVIISGLLMNEKRVRDSNGKVIFDATLLSVHASERPQASSYGNSFGLVEDLNVAIRHKEMARDLKDALTKGRPSWDCEATVSVGRITNESGKAVPVMIIHAIETSVIKDDLTGLERVRIGEDMYRAMSR